MNRVLKYILFFFLIVGAHESFGQWRLIMEVVVTDEGKSLAGSEIKVFRNNALVETVKTDGKGRADIPMEPDGNYTIEVGGNNGFITKKIAVNTNNVPAGKVKGDIFYPAEVEIFKEMEDLNLAILDQPIGKIFYDPEYEDFGADREHTKKVQEKLAALKEDYLAQKEEEAKNSKQREKDYKDAIKIADKAFSNEEWEKAAEEYKRAQELMPVETYPSFQLAELETKLIKIRETNQKYEEAISKADAAVQSGDLKVAIAAYKKASGIKPEEEYPKTKAEEIQEQLTNQAKNEQLYLAAINKGDNALQVNELETAKEAFEEAAKVKPKETYPQNKIAEINDILSKREAKTKEYQEAISSADEALAAKDYKTSKSEYEKALSLKPLEDYPKTQITKVEELMAEAAKVEQSYLAALEKGDNALDANDFSTAKTAFEEASSLKPEENYPKDKIKEIDQLLADREAKDKEYQEKVDAADQALANQNYEAAKTNYEEAKKLKPKESYPSEKITEIETILSELAAKEENYKKAIAKGDEAVAAENFEEAKMAFNEAIALKPEESYPKDQLAEIETIVLQNQQMEESYNKAIQDGDDAFTAEDFEASKKFYEKAIELKGEEKYPQEQLAAIEKSLKEREEKEANYTASIEEGDKALENNELEKAKTAFSKASSIKPEEEYPKEQLTAIEGRIAENQKLEEDYQLAIKDGDEAFASSDYSKAKESFKKAIALKEGESYPQEKLTEISTLLEQQQKKEENYQASIAKADESFEGEQWEEAKQFYEESLAIKKESYAENRIAEIEEKLAAIEEKNAAAAKLTADYQAAISKGDSKLEENDYEAAIAAYNNAKELKPEESYPIDQLAQIKAEQQKIEEKKAEEERLAKLEADYNKFIQQADAAFKEENFKDARKAYQEALAIKSEESYPQEKIAEINEKLADAEEQEQLYANAISAADALMEEEKLEEAKKKYSEALSIKSGEQYPKDQVEKIEEQLSALAAEQEEIRLKQERQAEKEEKYQALISKADQLFDEEDYEEAQTNYELALGVKEEGYPVKRIEEIQQIVSSLEEKQAAAIKEQKYQNFIAQADGELNKENFQAAKQFYEAALEVKEDAYPKGKIEEIDNFLAELAAKKEAEKEKSAAENQYLGIITQADEMFEAERFEKAKLKYEEALAIKEEQHPKDQLAIIEKELKKMEQRKKMVEEEADRYGKYMDAVEKGDQALSNEQFKEALKAYELARSLMPNETYPPNKIAQIEEILEREAISVDVQKKIIDAKYMESVTMADMAMLDQDYVDAKAYYTNAKSLKPKEEYPVKKLAEIDELMEKMEKKDEESAKNNIAYQKAITDGDQLFSEKKYTEAIEEYENAKTFKPKETYPQEKIDEIQAILDRKNEALAAQKKKESENAAYQELIAQADQAFEKESYATSKKGYQSALKIKSEEAYPKQQIEEIDRIMSERRLAEAQKQEEKEEEEPITIQKGPKKSITGDAEAEIDKMYEEMWAKKNEEKNQLIEEEKEKVQKMRDQEREEESKKRQNALERINEISISLKDQNEMSEELYLQNYETVKQNTENLNETESKLRSNSERERSNNFADAQSTEKSIREFRTDRRAELVDGKNAVVEKEYEDMHNSRKAYKNDQYENLKEAESEFLLKQETLHEVQKERNENMIEGKKELVESEYEAVHESIKTYKNDQYDELKEAEEDYVLKEKSIKEFNKNLAESNLHKNTEELDNTKSDWRATNQTYRSESDERRSNQMGEIDETQEAQREFFSSNSESYKSNQERVEADEKSLKEEYEKWVNESEKNRQANKDREFYEGEDRPREDPRASKYPQGVTEEIIENQNNSTTIRRIVAEGTEVDVYEKTLFHYGDVFYTKNGNNITEETWDAESR